MPTMANITVKKADGTTDVVYTALTPSAGDKSPARWRANAASSIPGNRPVVEISTRDNGTKDGRRVLFNGKFPILSTVSGVESVDAVVPFDLTMLVPQNVDGALVKEAVYQILNLCAHALIKQTFEEGQSPQ